MNITADDLPYIAIIFSVFFSFVAVIFNLYNFKEKKKHDVLMNKPSLLVGITRDYNNWTVKIEMSNNGLGVAFFQYINFYSNGVAFESFDLLLKEKFKKLTTCVCSDASTRILGINSPVLPGQKLQLLFGTITGAPHEMNTLFKVDLNLSIEFSFKDVFGNDFFEVEDLS